MKWIIGTIAFLLLAGPLRKWFLSNWRFCVPALLWGIVSFRLASEFVSAGYPWWCPVGIALFAAIGAGVAGKEWLDRVFGKGG